MKYLVDKKTKEHRPYYGGSLEWAEDQGLDIVRADSEGWIPHTGTECPLPDNCRHDVKFRNGDVERDIFPPSWDWRKDKIHGDITHYRPILTEQAEPVKEPDYDPRSVSFNPKSITEMINESGAKASPCIDVITRLSIAHSSAQQIPDLEAELREVLGSMGYDLVARSPFTQQRHGAQENNNEI